MEDNLDFLDRGTNSPETKISYEGFKYDCFDGNNPNDFHSLIVEYSVNNDFELKTIDSQFFSDKIASAQDGEYTIYNIVEHPDIPFVFCFFVYYHNLKDFQRMCIDVEDLILIP